MNEAVPARHDASEDRGAGSVPDVAAVIFVPHARVWQRAGTPGGLSLLERQLKQLRKLGGAFAVLLVPDGQPEPVLPPGCIETETVRVPAGVSDLVAALVGAMHRLPSASLAMSADRLVDLRVLRALLGRDDSTFATLDGLRPEPVAWIRAVDVRQHGGLLGRRAARLSLATLDCYSSELRGPVEPYVIASASPAEREHAWAVMLDHVQKRALDLPGQYFDTPFENFLVRRLAPTNVTPNQITLLTLLVAALVGVLFLHGWLRVGVLLALVVGVLDGVDGKLARLKLATSKLGELEHVGDFFYENGWYLALASYLSAGTQRAELWWAGWVLVACDLADSLLYLVVQRRTGKMLDEVSAFDRRFRAIAGRRNVYVTIFVAGFFAARASTAFLVAVTWALVTVGIHAVRAFSVPAVPPRSLGDQAPS